MVRSAFGFAESAGFTSTSMSWGDSISMVKVGSVKSTSRRFMLSTDSACLKMIE